MKFCEEPQCRDVANIWNSRIHIKCRSIRNRAELSCPAGPRQNPGGGLWSKAPGSHENTAFCSIKNRPKFTD